MNIFASKFIEVQHSFFRSRSCLRIHGVLSLGENPFSEREEVRELFAKYFLAEKSAAYLDIYCLTESETEQLNEDNLVSVKGSFTINTEERLTSFTGTCSLKQDVWKQLANETLTNNNGLLSLDFPIANAGEVKATSSQIKTFKSELSLGMYSWIFNRVAQPK